MESKKKSTLRNAGLRTLKSERETKRRLHKMLSSSKSATDFASFMFLMG